MNLLPLPLANFGANLLLITQLTRMSKIVSTFLTLFIFLSAFGQHRWQGTTIYIVRHAEKDTGNNPVLRPPGLQRSGDLSRYLARKNISRIYTTPFRRNEMTADSLRLQHHIDTTHYSPKPSAEELYNLVKANGDLGKNILFVGHSNTVPLLIRNFGVSSYPQTDLPDNAYDNIYRLRFKNHQVKLKAKKFGVRTP